MVVSHRHSLQSIGIALSGARRLAPIRSSVGIVFSLVCVSLVWNVLVVPSAAEEPAAAEEPSAGEPAATEAPTPLRSVIDRVRESVTTIRVEGRDGDPLGIGTGFVVDPAGLIATNFHVINEGRPFTVETAGGERLKVLSIEASDVGNDLALIRVDAGHPLKSLTLANADSSEQGMRVLAFGNPHGMTGSVVEGIVSARQTIDGQELLQLAMPIEPGNSGGPLVDLAGRVHGIINMKSAIDDNLGFAIPSARLSSLMDHPNPVAINRWVRLGRINERHWKPLFGGDWKQRGGQITAEGLGVGFGGRALLLSQGEVPEPPFEIAVTVKLDDESGAAGLVFHSDGGDRHYGFYPSGGQIRLSCFRGPSVYSWQVLHDEPSEHYLPGQWNDLKVRIEEDSIRCFVNGTQVFESDDRQLTRGKVGLAKFRGTRPEFKRFRIGRELPTDSLSDAANEQLAKLKRLSGDSNTFDTEQIRLLGESGEYSARQLVRHALELERRAKRLRQLADDVRRVPTLDQLARLNEVDESARLLEGALLIASLDQPDLDRQAYRNRIDEMADEVRSALAKDASPIDRRDALHQYLFAENGYHGSRSEYYHPANSHLDRVIDDREGLPITLAVLYIEIARRLEMKVDGVGLPGHFVVRHGVGEDAQLIDVFERGRLMSPDDAARLVLMHTGRAINEQDQRANSTNEILTRMLNNLVGIAGRDEDGEAMLRYSDAMVAINPDDAKTRMMRAQLRGFTGRDKAALEDIDRLLREDHPQLNRAAIERLRQALRSRLSAAENSPD